MPLASENFNYRDSRRVSHLSGADKNPEALLKAEFGEAYSQYREKWEMARTFQKRPLFPLHVDYEIKFGCNLKCPICPLSLSYAERKLYGEPEKSLSPDLVKELIAQGAAAGQKAMGFGGLWEPLLEPCLPEIISYAREKGLIDIMLNTNGQLLTKELGEQLIAAGLTRLMVSLDAAGPETYKKQRVGGSWERVVENLKSFINLRNRKNLKLPLVRVSFCLTSLNQADLPKFLEIWPSLADFISLQNYGNFLDDQGAFLFPETKLALPAPGGRCAQPWKRALVRHNGDVILCCDVSGFTQVIGNIHKRSLTEIWRSEPAEQLRRAVSENSLEDFPVCQKCQNKFRGAEK